VDGEIQVISPVCVKNFLIHQRWNAGRWDYEKSSLHSITEDIVKTASVVDANLRQKLQDWLTINRAMTSAKSIASGSVLMRDLAGVLKAEHVIDTESLGTLLVVVQKSMLRDWFSTYEALEIEDLKQLMGESGAFGARVVMPKSSVQIAEDNDSVLVTCVVLKRFSDQIKTRLRENKYMSREYSFEKAAGDNKEKSMEQLASKRVAARQDLLKFSQSQFAELLTCWVHLKVGFLFQVLFLLCLILFRFL
jgi:V-type H+-transporting ATPase subunit C